jgi:sugar diacid utilization regulator
VRDYNSLVRRKRELLAENQSDVDRYDYLQKEDESFMRQWKEAGGTVE